MNRASSQRSGEAPTGAEKEKEEKRMDTTEARQILDQYQHAQDAAGGDAAEASMRVDEEHPELARQAATARATLRLDELAGGATPRPAEVAQVALERDHAHHSALGEALDAGRQAQTLNEHVREVAAHLPFAVEVDADLGGTLALQIDLGRRGRQDDPRDTAGIDPEPDSRWWVDIEGGVKTHISNLGVDADPAEVAAWVANTAREEGCPAAVAAARTSAIHSACYPTVPTVDGVGHIAAQPATHAATDRSHER